MAVVVAEYVVEVGSGDYRRFMGPNYRRGYSTRNYHVTGEHEAEAEAAQRAKKPSRIGLLVLRLLGDRGPVRQVPDVRQVASSHRHPHRHPD
jgi:hypothetical protein